MMMGLNVDPFRLLSEDHRFVLERLKALELSLDDSKYDEALEIVRMIEQATTRHYAAEEDALFPVLKVFFDKGLKSIGGLVKPVGGPHGRDAGGA